MNLSASVLGEGPVSFVWLIGQILHVLLPYGLLAKKWFSGFFLNDWRKIHKNNTF